MWNSNSSVTYLKVWQIQMMILVVVLTASPVRHLDIPSRQYCDTDTSTRPAGSCKVSSRLSLVLAHFVPVVLEALHIRSTSSRSRGWVLSIAFSRTVAVVWFGPSLAQNHCKTKQSRFLPMGLWCSASAALPGRVFPSSTGSITSRLSLKMTWML